MIKRCRDIIKKYKIVFENFSYIAAMRIFVLISPLITYPYLTKVLGSELYGVVLIAQMLSSYASLLIDYGSNNVCAKHVAINKNNPKQLSVILSSVLLTRLILWILCFIIYAVIIYYIDDYRNYCFLFLLSYGYTFNELLFPQFFFQGIEQMKYTSIVNISIKVFFVLLIFVTVRTPNDYLFVPILYAVGYFLGGLVSLIIINKKLKISYTLPSFNNIKFYIKDSAPIFATDIIASIKDKVNYLLVGQFAGMSNVVVYDLGLKLTGVINQPMGVLCTVLFPKFARNRNIFHLKRLLGVVFLISFILVLLVNVFLEDISCFFIHEKVDLLPVRIFLLSPLFLSISTVLAYNYFLAFGYNKYILYGIIVTALGYIISIFIFFITDNMNNMYVFVVSVLVSYLIEMIYKLYVFKKNVKHDITIRHEINSAIQ